MSVRGVDSRPDLDLRDKARALIAAEALGSNKQKLSTSIAYQRCLSAIPHRLPPVAVATSAWCVRRGGNISRARAR